LRHFEDCSSSVDSNFVSSVPGNEPYQRRRGD
jgi:hypothetical protein